MRSLRLRRCGVALTTVAAAAFAVAAPGSFGGLTAADAASGAGGSSVVNAPVFSPTITLDGSVTLSDYGPPPSPKTAGSEPASSSNAWKVEDPQVAARKAAASSTPPPPPTVKEQPVTSSEAAGESGFAALNGAAQAAANGGVDLEPPDQGLCASPSYTMEFINNALTIYQSDGSQVLPVIPSYALFKQPSRDFFSDPRCYYDAPTGRWFLQEFIVGTESNGKATSPSIQFLAVSDSSDPTGSYNVWYWDTTDARTKGCPCFGDYDNLGADDNGIYVATDEFSVGAPFTYNGVILYAVSKELIETYSSTGIAPTVFGYRLTKDFFGQPYVVAPASTPQGASFAPGTEYFLESNGNAFSDNHLEVYALNDTSDLASPAPPTLYTTVVQTESYAFPPDANQAPGSTPLGNAVQDPEGMLQADFDAEMEPTFVNGNLYGQLDTATTNGPDAAAWFILHPTLSGSTLHASIRHQGYVATNTGANLIYPYTTLDASGVGYMVFALSGSKNWPSAAYIAYGPKGPEGPVRIAASGAAPDDGFTCYAAFVGPNYGGCRWGDYSMGVATGGQIELATEYIPPTSRDYLTNWGTYIFSAPPPR